MKIIKKLFVGVLSLFLILVVALAMVPYMFGDKIKELVKTELNDRLDAQVDFKDIRLSVFKSFPELRVEIDSLTITGIEEFQGKRLADIGSFVLDMDIMSVIKKDRSPEVKEIAVKNSLINLFVHSDGKANYNIYTAPQSEEVETEPVIFDLDKLTLEQCGFNYVDEEGELVMGLNGINGTSKIKYRSEELFTANAIEVSDVDLVQAGITYMKNGRLKADADIDIDLNDMIFNLQENRIVLNALVLEADGMVGLKENYQHYDLSFSCPKNDFSQFLSLIPSAFTKDFDDVKASGKLALSGKLKGNYSQNEIPAFDINLNVDNGSFQYPGFAQDVQGINAKGKISSSSDINTLLVDFSRLNVSIDGDQIESRFRIEDAMTDPYVQAEIKGKLNLEKLSNAYPMPDLKEASGLLDAFVQMDARLSHVEKQDYSKVISSGYCNSEALSIQYAEYPLIKTKTVNAEFTPQMLSVQADQIYTDGTQGRADVKVRNYLQYIMGEGRLDVMVDGDFSSIDANEFLIETESDPSDTALLVSNPMENVDMELIASVKRLRYSDYEIEDIIVHGEYKKDKVRIEEGSMNWNGSDMSMTGSLENPMNYYLFDEALEGDLSIKSQKMDLNTMMGDSEASDESSELSIIPVPENMNLVVKTDIDEFHYGNYELTDVKGKLVVSDERLKFEDFSSYGLGGRMGFTGSYDTKDVEEPKYAIDYDMSEMRFSKFFTTIETFDKIVPIAKFIDGVFNSSIALSGTLNEKMMPVYSTLDGNGFLHTMDGTVKGLPAIEKISQQFDVKELKGLSLKNTKNWLSIEDGRVTIKEFDIEEDGIKMKIGGSHSIAQEMNYNIIADIPKSKMDGNIAGKTINKGLDFIEKEASKYKLNLDSGDSYRVQISVNGKLSDPQLKFKLLGTSNQTAEDVVEEKIDEIVEEVKDSVNTLVEQKKDEITREGEEKVEEIKDTVKTVVEERVEEIKDEVKDKAKKEVEEKLNEEVKEKIDTIVGDKVKEVLGDDAQKGADKVKEELEKWNPFKKKKKDGE